ncbi:MAG: hypothetical protein H0X49_09175, partial [Acidobacteria bacterium]|nr:hypothetical protein [Acidobacteriota bacterium]
TILTQSATVDQSLPATIFLNQTPPTNPNQPFGSQSGAPGGWNNPNQFSLQPPPKKSKTWIWILGILGGLMLLCGGSFAGFVYWAANLEKTNRTANKNYEFNYNVKSPTPIIRTGIQKIHLSRWVKGDTNLGVTEFKGGEFMMRSKNKGFYFVLASPTTYKTENATTRVTVRNVNEDDTSLGFGLIIHSSPVPLTQDYAFIIDSENKQYRIVRHSPQEEIPVEDWTRSSAIKDGTQKNVLEVRDENKKMNFYINGEFIKTINNTDGYIGGVTGLYSGDAVQIAFSDFEIAK